MTSGQLFLQGFLSYAVTYAVFVIAIVVAVLVGAALRKNKDAKLTAETEAAAAPAEDVKEEKEA